MSVVNFQESALEYATRLGWCVFPLAEGSKVPARQGGHGVKEASRYPDDIIAWSKDYPHANIGVACGVPSGVVVLDVDPRNGGSDTLAKHASQGHVLPPTPRARTGNGGWHYYFRMQPGVTNSKNRLGSGVDIKSTGGYVVGAPSWIRPSKDGVGGTYTWLTSPHDVPVARLPIWISVMLAPRPQKLAPDIYYPTVGMGDEAVERLASFIESSQQGTRNNRLHWAACRCGEMISQRRAQQDACVNRLARAGVKVGLDYKEVMKTIQSAFRLTGGR